MSRTALIAVALAGCASALPESDARYSGRIAPLAACGEASPATLLVRGPRFSFTPTDGVLLIEGEVGGDGALAGSLTTQGVDRKPFTMSLNARIVGAEVSGTYITPRCRFEVALRRR